MLESATNYLECLGYFANTEGEVLMPHDGMLTSVTKPSGSWGKKFWPATIFSVVISSKGRLISFTIFPQGAKMALGMLN